MAMERKTRYRVLTAIATASVTMVAGIWLQTATAQSPGMKSSKSQSGPPVSSASSGQSTAGVFKVVKGQVIKELVLTGELRAERSIKINAPDVRSSFANMVTYLAPEGSQIKKGERIVEFDDSNLLSQKSEAERTLDESKLNIEKTKADQEAQRANYMNSLSQAESQLKQDALYAKLSKDLLPGNTWQKYQLNYQKSKLSYDKAKEQLENFEKSYASQMQLVEISRSQAEINLKKIVGDMTLLKVDAPQDGILIYGDNWQSNRKIQTGDTLFPGMEVASLPDLTSMQVVGYVYDTEYGSLAPGMPCSVSLDSLPDFSVGGKLLALTSVGSRKSFTSEKKVFQAVVQLDKVDAQVMKPGMTARVQVPLVMANDTLTIPREYLGYDNQGRSYVLFKEKDAKTGSSKFVKVGSIGDRLVQIISGVSLGDPLLPLLR